MYNAHLLNPVLGSLTITHPYHPLKGQNYDILKIKKINGVRHYSLDVGDDVVCVPESWTDRHIVQQMDADDTLLPFNTYDLMELARLLKMFKK